VEREKGERLEVGRKVEDVKERQYVGGKIRTPTPPRGRAKNKFRTFHNGEGKGRHEGELGLKGLR